MGSFKVEAIPMYNLSPPRDGQIYHDKGRGNGYILTYGGKRFYFSGDTEGIPEMKALRNIDVAFVCMNLPFTMTPGSRAKRCARSIRRWFTRTTTAARTPMRFAKALEGTGIEVRLRDWYAK